MKYGDLEVFLFGLDLGEFHKVFLLHHVDFALLLTLTEDDLISVSTDMYVCGCMCVCVHACMGVIVLMVRWMNAGV